MLSIQGETADAIWCSAAEVWRREALPQSGRDQETRELLHVAFSLTSPRNRLVFSRPMNPAFAFAEVVWILAGRNDLEFLRRWNPRMKRFSDDGSTLHGAYGYRLRRHFGALDQLHAARQALENLPDSRQVVLQIWDAEHDLPVPLPRSRDVPCNLVSHLLLRGGRLDWLQVMRSTDLVWGLPYNLVQFTTLQEIMAGWLGVNLGSYDHISSSLHVYRRHWNEMELLPPRIDVPRNKADLRMTYAEWAKFWPSIEELTWSLTEAQARSDVEQLIRRFGAPDGYAQCAALMGAERLRQLGLRSAAETLIQDAGEFWETSWRAWSDARANPERRDDS